MALIRELETFLLELGGDFTFVGRQKRLRIGDEWYRIDLLFFHRKLRCLVVADLKLGKFTHADAGQMHLYLNYAREHWTNDGENPPVGVILDADEVDQMRSQFVTASAEAGSPPPQTGTASRRNIRHRPYAFTEQGVAMLSSVLSRWCSTPSAN